MSFSLNNLSSEYNTLLTEYTNTYQNYINTLKSKDNNLISIPETSYIGESNINIINNTNLEVCKSSCESDTRCSGASYNNSNSICILSTGLGNINPSPQYTAIVQQALYYTNQLQILNTKLLNINKQMMSKTNNSLNQFQQTQHLNQQQEQILNNNYQTLSQERLVIDKMVKQFETLNAAYENGNINVTSNYYFYIVLIFVTIFLIGLLMRFSLLTKDNFTNETFIPSIIIFIFCIFLIYYLIQR